MKLKPLPLSLIFTTFLLSSLCAQPVSDLDKSSAPSSKSELPSSLKRYLDLINQYPKIFGPLGQWQQGEIEITLAPEKIQKIENQTRLRMVSKGIDEADAEKWSSVGVVAEDNYWIWVRDAVIFPSGVYGTYDRLMWKTGLDGIPGVAILPLLASRKVIVNINYRHATRSWELEIPRGGKKQGESPEKAAARELKEETGYLITKTTLLGTLAPDTGALMSLVPVYSADVTHSGDSKRNYSEAIIHNPAYSKEELKQGFARGYIEVPIKGELVKAYCRDPFLAYALLQAETKGLL